MNERIEKMKQSVDALNSAGVRDTHFYSLVYESLQQTQGEPLQLRRAKAQAYLLDNAPPAVLPHELIAGSMTGLCPLAENVPDYEAHKRRAISVLREYLKEKAEGPSAETAGKGNIKTFEAEFTGKKSRWALMHRVHHDANITYPDLQRLIAEMELYFAREKELEKYEIGRELERAFKLDYGRGVKEAVDALPWFAANHLSLNYGTMVRTGLAGAAAWIEDQLRSADSGEKKEFYQAAKIVIRALIRFMLRYAGALGEASAECGGERKTELLEMSGICKKIALAPPATFREGLQMVWLLHIAASVQWCSALSFGRFDQYMHTLYQQDVQSGALSREQAKELLCCLWLKINEPKLRTVQSMTLGGITPEGRDAANELTSLCLEVIRQLRLPYPNVGVRINKANPPWLTDLAVEAVKSGGGQPMLMNDEVWINGLKRLGYEDRYANDYYNMGCVEIMIPGKQPNWGVTDPIAFPMLLENVFEKYRGGKLSADRFEDFYRAYEDELKAAVLADEKEAKAKIADMPGKCYDPFASLFIDGCLEAGRDLFQGGSELGTHWSFYAYGLGTAADSLAAVKKYVYEEKILTLDDMSAALGNNFENRETLRKMLENQSPHYGNDTDEVDSLAAGILSRFTQEVLGLNRPGDKNKYVSTLFGYFFHIYHGEITGATPNGRKRGEPFSDSMGPSQGKDRNGPTKMLNSVLKLDHTGVTGGYALNLKLNPDLVQGRAGTLALKALIQVYLRGGGPQLQVNFVDAEALKQAKKEPEKHRDLIVRIGGYCEYFVNLDSALQDEIITRTVHNT